MNIEKIKDIRKYLYEGTTGCIGGAIAMLDKLLAELEAEQKPDVFSDCKGCKMFNAFEIEHCQKCFNEKAMSYDEAENKVECEDCPRFKQCKEEGTLRQPDCQKQETDDVQEFVNRTRKWMNVNDECQKITEESGFGFWLKINLEESLNIIDRQQKEIEQMKRLVAKVMETDLQNLTWLKENIELVKQIEKLKAALTQINKYSSCQDCRNIAEQVLKEVE